MFLSTAKIFPEPMGKWVSGLAGGLAGGLADGRQGSGQGRFTKGALQGWLWGEGWLRNCVALHKMMWYILEMRLGLEI